MAEITATQVKELRNNTNVSMMECKRALVESGGDMEKATILLRERGMAVAAKKASRSANQGLIASSISEDRKIGAIIEVNCETDFVAKNDNFKNFVDNLAKKACNTEGCLVEETKEELTAKIVEIGENIVLRNNTRYIKEENGAIVSYIHLGGKVGVLLDIACEHSDTVEKDIFKDLAKDIALHITASAPQYITSNEVPEDIISGEREIYAKQVENKPPQVIDKIVNGKLKKFFTEICLIEQGFIKDPKQSVKNLLSDKSKELGDSLNIKRFVRYQIGG